MLEILSANLLTRLLALAAATWLTFGWCRRFGNAFVPLACGLLLSVALGHLLPEAFSSGADPERVGQSALAVVVFFVLFEGLLHAWGGHAAHGAHRPHGNDRGVEAFALLFGCSLHGFVDGIVVAGAFQVSGSLGWLAAGAVLLHEIPQEAGSMALVKSLGWPRGRTIAVFLIPAASTLAGGAAGSLFLSHSAYLPHVLAASAASFLFITLRSFLPEVMSAERSRRGVVADILLFLAGVGLSFVLLGHIHPEGAGHAHFEHAEVSQSVDAHAH
ncbi:MAG TPA: ZIP family metal transporter [Candidatus Sutterella merdavium]|nr:ZIP family metal transporter [Candidatus Sutterella merdavium]